MRNKESSEMKALVYRKNFIINIWNRLFKDRKKIYAKGITSEFEKMLLQIWHNEAIELI